MSQFLCNDICNTLESSKSNITEQNDILKKIFVDCIINDLNNVYNIYSVNVSKVSVVTVADCTNAFFYCKPKHDRVSVLVLLNDNNKVLIKY